MPDSERLQRLAHLEKDCPECGGQQQVPSRIAVIGHFGMIDCPTCGGIGKVFVFGYMVRVRCRYPDCHKGQQLNKNGVPEGDCANCRGRGTVASQDMAVWVKTFCKTWLIEFRTVQVKTEQGERVEIVNCSLYTLPDRDWIAGADAPDPFEALIAALEAANGKEKGWLKRESSVE